MATKTVEIHLPRHCAFTVGRIDADELSEFQRSFAEAESKGQGLVVAERRDMHVSEIQGLGLATGQIRTTLRCLAIGDVELYFKGLKKAQPEGMKILAVIPPGAVGQAMMRVFEAEQAA